MKTDEEVPPGLVHRESSIKPDGVAGAAGKKSSMRIERAESRGKSIAGLLDLENEDEEWEEPGRKKSVFPKKSVLMVPPTASNMSMSIATGDSMSMSLLNLADADLDASQERITEAINLQFFGGEADEALAHRRKTLIASLQKRNLSAEMKRYRPPAMQKHRIDLGLKDERKAKILSVFPVEVLRRLDKKVPTVDHEVLTDYELQLPAIGSVRHKSLGKPARDKLKTKPRIIMPEEGVVRNPFFVPADVPGYMVRHEAERIKVYRLYSTKNLQL